MLYCRVFEHEEVALRSCLSENFLKLVVRSGDPAHELPRIDEYARITGGFLASNCHILMHTVGRRFGKLERVSLAHLQDYLPRSNDPSCSAGFAHGLITWLGPEILRIGPGGAASACRRSATRYQRYSCVHGLGHAYMRLYMESFMASLPLCRALGPDDAADCAQGAFHDYWLAVKHLDGTRRSGGSPTSPRALCARQPTEFVRPCWYRVFLELSPKRPVTSANDIVGLCEGLRSLQRLACITGASVISTGDPAHQAKICADLRGEEAVSCIRGIAVPRLARSRLSEQVRLVSQCANFGSSAREGCYEWFGKTLSVVTNGRFEREGCTKLARATSVAACRRGARAAGGALETFS